MATIRNLKRVLSRAPWYLEALRRTGSPAEVAHEYANLDQTEPREWQPRAAVVAALVDYLLLAVLQQREFRLQRAPHWGDFDPWRLDLWLFRLSGDLEQQLVLHIEVNRLTYVVAPLLAMLAFSRIWRRGEFHRRRSARVA